MSSKTESAAEKKNSGDKVQAASTNLKCSCKDPVKKFTSKKEGPNKGRDFYACSKPKGDGCNFFKWTDEAEEEDDGVLKCRCGKPAKEMMVKKEGPNKGRKYHGCPNGWGKSCGFFKWIDDDPACLNADENAIKCGCGLGAKAFTSKKEGPNQGRQFYSCSRPKGKGCNFFEWADDVNGKDGATEKTAKKRASTGGDESAAKKKK